MLLSLSQNRREQQQADYRDGQHQRHQENLIRIECFRLHYYMIIKFGTVSVGGLNLEAILTVQSVRPDEDRS